MTRFAPPRFLACASLVALAVGASACGGIEDIDFQFRSAPPDNAIISYDQIRIHEGVAVGVTAVPLEDGEAMDTETRLELKSNNQFILGIGPAPKDPDLDEDEANWNFVIYGASAGQTSVTVVVDGEAEVDIPAMVDPQ